MTKDEARKIEQKRYRDLMLHFRKSYSNGDQYPTLDQKLASMINNCFAASGAFVESKKSETLKDE